MNVSLPPELEHAIQVKVASGLYCDAGEVIREALRQAFAREEENQWISREAAIGWAQLEAGQVVEVDSEEQFMALVRGDS